MRVVTDLSVVVQPRGQRAGRYSSLTRWSNTMVQGMKQQEYASEEEDDLLLGKTAPGGTMASLTPRLLAVLGILLIGKDAKRLATGRPLCSGPVVFGFSMAFTGTVASGHPQTMMCGLQDKPPHHPKKCQAWTVFTSIITVGAMVGALTGGRIIGLVGRRGCRLFVLQPPRLA